MNSCTLAMPAECTLRSIHLIARQWQEQLGNAQHVALDASDPERVSTAAIQLILSLAKTTEASGGGMHIRAISPALTDALHLLGLSSFLKETSQDERMKPHV